MGGVTDLGLYSPSSGTFYLRTEFAPGPADLILDFGPGNPLDENPVVVQMMRTSGVRHGVPNGTY